MRLPISLANYYLETLKSLKIKKCFRLFYNDSYKDLPKDKMFIKSDGVIYLQFSNNALIAFYPYTEKFSIYTEVLNEKLSEDVIDITSDSYFEDRINIDIENVQYLYSEKNRPPYGICFMLSNKENIKIEYSSENEFSFDSLILN